MSLKKFLYINTKKIQPGWKIEGHSKTREFHSKANGFHSADLRGSVQNYFDTQSTF